MRVLLLFCLLLSKSGFAGEIFSIFPEHINPNGKYVFYSHGLIVEGDNSSPEHPRWGVYDYPSVIQALSHTEHYLIAYHRPKNTEPNAFAQKLADDVLQLINKGVKPHNISLVGFSRGGAITLLTSKLLSLIHI